MKRVAAIFLILFAARESLRGSSEAELASKTIDLVFSVQDLVMTVKDLGGNVQSLAVTEEATEIRIDLSADVLFDFDRAEVLPGAAEVLGKAADFIRQKGFRTVRIEGHTDSVGKDPYNQKLSERRARAVENWFVKNGHLSNVRFSTAGFGATRPVVPNRKPDGSDDPAGRQKNRRVEIIIEKH